MRLDGQKYYENSCLYGTCPKCNGFALLMQCIHESEDHEFGRIVVDMQSFKYITYQIDGWKERKKITSMMS